jgi:hypothetical protein
MTKLILITALTMSLSTYAARPDVCLNVKTVSAAIMEARQDGRDAQEVVSIVSQEAKQEWVYKAYMYIVINAYEMPIFETDMYKQQAVKEFANKYYIACWKGSV